MAIDEVIGEGQKVFSLRDELEREEKARAASVAGAERFLPRTEGMAATPTIPSGLGFEGPGADLKQKFVRVSEEEMGEVGGAGEYMDIYFGGADLSGFDEDNVAIVEKEWQKIFKAECPYDFSGTDKESQYALATKELEQRLFEGLSRNKMKVDILRTDGIEVEFDLGAKPGEYISQVLERLGGLDFIKDIWRNCRVITLKRPFDEDSDWVIILQAWKDSGAGGGKGEWKRFALKLPDFERALILDESRQIKLPELKSGDIAEQAKFKVALGKIKMRGATVAGAALFVEDWPKKG